MGDQSPANPATTTAKPRIHFGSLEGNDILKKRKIDETASAARGGIDLESLGEAKGADLSGTSRKAYEEDLQVKEEFIRRERARAIAVPTDDKRVRQGLQARGEPQCLFGEGPAERRDRLRHLMSEAGEIEAGSDSESDEEDEEEFFSVGTHALLEARQWITPYSLERAKRRIELQKKERQIPVQQLKIGRQELNSKLKTYGRLASQRADDRPVAQCAFSPDSSMLLTGAWSGRCKLWSIPDCKHIMTFKGHSDRIRGVAFRPGSTTSLGKSEVNFCTGGADSNIHLYSLDSETPLAILEGHVGAVGRVAFHPSGRYVGSAGFDCTWRLWDVETKTELLMQEGHRSEVYPISFQCDGSLVATGGQDAIGHVWDMRTGRSALVLEGHMRQILGIDWSPNGHHVATASADDTVKIWDVRQLRSIHTIAAHTSNAADVKFSTGTATVSCGEGVDTPIAGLYLATAGFDGFVKIWSGDDYRLIKTLEGHEGHVHGVDISNDGEHIASVGKDGTFKLWGQDDLFV